MVGLRLSALGGGCGGVDGLLVVSVRKEGTTVSQQKRSKRV
jgi:hypothetical protein